MHTSALLAPSLSWDSESIRALRPGRARSLVQRESLAWQVLSQSGAEAEFLAMPSVSHRIVRLKTGAGTEDAPGRPRRQPPPNRLLEVHGLAGAIGEQLGLAWTAEQDVQRLVATAPRREPEHQRFIQRAVTEVSAHFLLGGSHSLANLVLRLLLLNPNAAQTIKAAYPGAAGFPAFSDDRQAWISLNRDNVRKIRRAARVSGNRFMSEITDPVRALLQSSGFHDLEARRGMDYHRRRPQSVIHTSPREAALTRTGDLNIFEMPSGQLEPLADADHLHVLVVAAMESLRTAMRDVRRTMPKMIRAERIAYVIT